MQFLFIAVLFVFFLVVGVVNYRRANLHLKSYVLANRSQDAWSVGLSLSAVIVGASATLGMAGLVYKMGIVGIWWLLSGVAGLLVLYFFLSQKAHALGVMTISEALGKFYGEPARVFSGVLIVIAWAGIVAAQIIAAGKTLNVIYPKVGFDYFAVFTGVFVILYTVIGGQYAVFRTDKVQFIILFIGLVLTAVFLAFRFPLQVNHELLKFPVNKYFTPGKLLLFLLVVGIPYAVGPDMYSRIFSARSSRDARRGVLFTVFAIIGVAASIGVIGLYAHHLTRSPDKILIVMVNIALPSILSYIFVASILASVISSADTCLFSASSILALDILRFKSVNGVKLVAVFMGIISIIIALYFGEIIKTMLIAYGIYTGSVAVPLLFGFFNEKLKITPVYVWFAIGISAIVSFYFALIKDPYAGLISICISFFVMAIGAVVSRMRYLT